MRIALVAALVLTSYFAYADEGQWQPYQMLSIADKLQQRGIDIPAAQLADLGQYPMNAVVSLGYCTASFVSPQGLVVTNHHCAYRGIQYNSKKEHNYLADGFLAHTQAEEPSAGPNERLYITEEVTNVTDKVLTNLSQEPLARFEGIQTNSKALVKECEVDSNYRCQVDSFHHGLEYYLTKRLIIRDVRLVYAPPETVGGFGGDIDNYEYPRHSGDFTFLRAYVGKDGKPAIFDKDNVPYQPKSYLTINPNGVKAGDGIFVAGYPGATSRYNLTSELQFASDWLYPTFAERYQLQIDTITLMGEIDKDIALKYAGTMASMANRMKKLNGLLDGFNATDIVGIKQQRENDFLAWLKQDPDANQNLIIDLEALLSEQHQQMQTNYFYKNALSSEMLTAASKLYRLAKERQKPNDKREPGYQLRDMKLFKADLKRIDSRFDPAVDKTLWLQDLQAYVRQPVRNTVFDNALSISENFEELESKVEGLYALTELTDQTKRLNWLTKKAIDFETSEDPFIRLAVAIHDTNMALEQSEKLLEGKLSSVRPEYMKAIIDYYKSNNWPVYPDANRTLRITYGMVDGYQSKDAMYKQPFTRLEGLLAKHTGKEPFNVPAKLLAAIKSDDLGKHRVTSVYQQPSNCQFMSCLDKPADFNSVPVNFLSSADTTGGNSGSPVFNGKGELVGLNFDSTYEAITKDWFFNPTITRAVHVDIRYILWMMDKVDHADNLIKELKLDEASLQQAAQTAANNADVANDTTHTQSAETQLPQVNEPTLEQMGNSAKETTNAVADQVASAPVPQMTSDGVVANEVTDNATEAKLPLTQ
ncbi:MAG: S46 family peptidase [Shewanella sp.]|uniref:S46 family peptidase n=1 Tax=Shewanella sp. TaxID=50422 RepID=UPI003C764408